LVIYPDTGHGILNHRRDSFQDDAATDAWHRISQWLDPATSATREAWRELRSYRHAPH